MSVTKSPALDRRSFLATSLALGAAGFAGAPGFAVVARDGTPRTMFKPTTGADYWAEQKAAAPTFGQRRQSTTDAG